MASRPAFTALGCLGCRTAMCRAVLSPTAPVALRMLPMTITRRNQRLQPVAWRPFSSAGKEAPPTSADHEATLEAEAEEAEAETSPETTPWFLDEAPPQHPPSQHSATLPTPPEDAPAMMGSMIKYIYEDMGLDDLSLLDLRDLDPQASLGPNLIMLFGTARSERHLHVSSGRFVRWVRRNCNVGARAEGLIGPGELKTKLRRLRKKAKLMGQNTAMIPGGDHGISTGWVCVNFRATTEGRKGGDVEAARFDESGAMSGFGSSEHGTTIVVQCMTESRRNELDLESLWKGILRRNLDQQAKIRGEKVDAAQLDELLASRLQLHEAPGTSQFDAMKRASEQHRYFSTSARRRVRTSGTSAISNDPIVFLQQSDANPETDALRRAILDVQVGGAPMDHGRLKDLVSAILCAGDESILASDRLSLVDQIFQTASERGLDVRSRPVLIATIESLLDSPVYGPELSRAQQNMEVLLTELDSAPTVSETARLMGAYGRRSDWSRFWDAFRTPSRFNEARAPVLYELAYRTMASTADAALCTDALRWVYPEMLMEKTPVELDAKLYHALKSCILVADPAAEELLANPPPVEGLSKVQRRALERREFVRVLREVEALRMNAKQ
ncbi:ATPase synthesis protein 25, mitochondrial [Geosmithia morbida]|uniref:ATPase synthesis protein 25 n=1 Tax=Geosmithia morbida TaxID=1094350 RepID=A0A9P4YTX9_9HYPO|nr:ATPase synthesis protein 25, mitochondrial [Geosmithia morbida]KAF4123038.1 ATPase synthesis protein 25, mitochondrial [Geosmithia morbida]